MRRIQNCDGPDPSALLSADKHHAPAITPVSSSWGCVVWNLQHSTGSSGAMPDWQIHCSECNTIWSGACWTSHKSSDLMFLDKHFKENKDKGSLYGAICSIQPLIQLNIFVASQRAYCDLPGLHRRMLYPCKVTLCCIPVFHPEEDHGKKLQLSHHPSLGSLCWGCCSNPDLKHAERIFYS